jgi:starch phosphorylase
VAQAELGRLRVGDAFTVTVPVHLGELHPDDVVVELYYGQLNMKGAITASHRQPMTASRETDLPGDLSSVALAKGEGPAKTGDGQHIFECRLECRTTGRYGFTARIMPRGDAWTQTLPGFLTWAE